MKYSLLHHTQESNFVCVCVCVIRSALVIMNAAFTFTLNYRSVLWKASEYLMERKILVFSQAKGSGKIC